MNPLGSEVIFHARFSSAKAAILEAAMRAENGDPQLLPVLGPTRVGKTTLLTHAVCEINRQKPDNPHNVVSVISPKTLTARALADACLASIGMSPTMFSNLLAATNAFTKAVNKRGTRLIIFDETQHMLERGSSTTVRTAADFLKGLFDQSQCTIVLAGLPSLLGLFGANEQLADRSRRPIEFYPYYWQGADYKDFRAALAAALAHLADLGWTTFDPKDPEFARRMYLATAGRYGLIRKLFQEVQATGRPSEALYPTFAKAYEAAVMGRLIEFNPFNLEQAVQTEHLARVYASIMLEAGVKV